VVTPKATVDRQAFPLKEKIIPSEKDETAGYGQFILELCPWAYTGPHFSDLSSAFLEALGNSGYSILLMGGVALIGH